MVVPYYSPALGWHGSDHGRLSFVLAREQAFLNDGIYRRPAFKFLMPLPSHAVPPPPLLKDNQELPT